MLRVLVAAQNDDDRDRLCRLLEYEPDAAIIGRLGVDRLEDVLRHSPADVLVCDAGALHGTEQATACLATGTPAVPIVIADHGGLAALAFEIGAADYLLTPFSDERFAGAFERARRAVRARNDISAPPQTGYARRIMVQISRRWVAIDVSDVDVIRGSGSYADVFANQRRYTIRKSLSSFESQLDPAEFTRIHRSMIVPLRRVASFHRLPSGDGLLHTTGGAILRVSRARRPALERRLGLRG